MEHETQDVTVHFECFDCKATEYCNVSEAIMHGHPICDNCHIEMDLTHINTKD